MNLTHRQVVRNRFALLLAVLAVNVCIVITPYIRMPELSSPEHAIFSQLDLPKEAIQLLDEDVCFSIYRQEKPSVHATYLLKNRSDKKIVMNLALPPLVQIWKLHGQLKVTVDDRLVQPQASELSIFEPGQIIRVEVETSYVSHPVKRLAMPRGYPWASKSAQKLLETTVVELNYFWDNQCKWRTNKTRRSVSFVLCDGLTEDNVVVIDPIPAGISTNGGQKAQFATSFNFLRTGEPDTEVYSVEYMPQQTSTQLYNLYEKLLPKHPRDVDIIFEMGELLQCRNRVDDELKLYADFLLANPKHISIYADIFVENMQWRFTEATEETHNQKLARKIAPVFRRILGPRTKPSDTVGVDAEIYAWMQRYDKATRFISKHITHKHKI